VRGRVDDPSPGGSVSHCASPLYKVLTLVESVALPTSAFSMGVRLTIRSRIRVV
jgi:hypothetical protein